MRHTIQTTLREAARGLRHALCLIIACLPMAAAAQTGWQLPEKTATQQTATADKDKATKAKTETTAAKPKREVKAKDMPYLQGAVPEVDGKVVYAFDIDLPGKNADLVYDAAYKALEQLAADEHQIEGSRIVLVDKEQKSIVAKYNEWLVFSDKFLVLDRTEFNYIIIAKCSDGKAHFSIERLVYKYDMERHGEVMTAEETITDRLMISKDGTRLKKMNSKFRKKTVDRMRQVAESLGASMH